MLRGDLFLRGVHWIITMSSIRTSEVDDVVAIIKEEKQLQEDLKKLEKQIYGLETSYLESTSAAGNLVRGWGDTLSRPPSSSSRKKRKVAQEDRIFSLSSATAMQVQILVHLKVHTNHRTTSRRTGILKR